tara:strand:+ start:506 stop:916 length:411 start_codon:yes stop_codon:yes gene_type:complete
MNNLDEENNIESKLSIKNTTPEETIIHFFNSCNIKCEKINDINGIIIPREGLLDPLLYDKIKPDIPKIKQIMSSSLFTSVQKNADLTQKWPLINLIRQILRKYNYNLNPKRISDGYTKDGIKKYKRFFEIKKIKVN